jgi:hypothetical protein
MPFRLLHMAVLNGFFLPAPKLCALELSSLPDTRNIKQHSLLT